MSGSESGDGGGGTLIPVLLSRQQLETLLSFLRNPFGFVASIITLYILNGLFSIIDVVAGSILFVFDVVVGSLRTAQALLVGAFGAVGVDIFGALVGVQQALSGVVAAAGPLGPPLAVAAASLMLYGLYRLTVALLGELPGGSTIVDLLGVR